jgi:hypothetical protein
VRYIALLRRINVGGHTVRMEHLRGLFREIGLADVHSYIQSGNVFFADPAVEREEGCLSDHRRPRQNLARHVSDESPHYWRAAPAPDPGRRCSPGSLDETLAGLAYARNAMQFAGAVLQGTHP